MTLEKLHTFDAMIANGSVFVHLNPRLSGVVVPDHLRDQDHLNLEFGLDVPVPIVGLCWTADGITGTLSFYRRPFRVFIPWDAVFVLCSRGDLSSGRVFPDDVPMSVIRELTSEIEHMNALHAREFELDQVVERERARPSSKSGNTLRAVSGRTIRYRNGGALDPLTATKKERAANPLHVLREDSRGVDVRVVVHEGGGRRKRVSKRPFLRSIKGGAA